MDALDGEPRAAAPALRVEGLAYRYVRHEVWSDVSFRWRPRASRF